jgi:hypothetical protein
MDGDPGLHRAFRRVGPKFRLRRRRTRNLETGVRVELNAQEMQAPAPIPLRVSSPVFSEQGRAWKCPPLLPIR